MREDPKTLAAKMARQVFSDRHHSRPAVWTAVHLHFPELCAILEDVIKTIRNEEQK